MMNPSQMFNKHMIASILLGLGCSFTGGLSYASSDPLKVQDDLSQIHNDHQGDEEEQEGQGKGFGSMSTQTWTALKSRLSHGQYPAKTMKTVEGDLIDWIQSHSSQFQLGDVVLFDLDYTVWNGNFDSKPSYDLKYARHAKYLAAAIAAIQAKGVKVFGFTGKPLYTEQGEMTDGDQRTRDGLATAKIKFSPDLDTFKIADEIQVKYGVVFTNPTSSKRSVDAKRDLINPIGALTKAKRIFWVDDQDVEYARNKKFSYPLYCYPFMMDLGLE